MIKILDQTKTLATLVSDTSNGLGMIQPISGTVTEELNGEYEAEFVVSVDEKRFPDLSVGGLLKLTPNETSGEQIFRIYEISVPFNSRATVKACHISYDLNKTVVLPFNSTGASNTVTGMTTNAVDLNGFTMTTDITNTTSDFELVIPKYFRECLGGWEGSLLDVFRGEYEYDNLEVKMLSRRGKDNGVRIAYGKNLTDYRQDENNENTHTAVLGYAVVDDVTYTGNVYTKVSSTNPRTLIVDFSGDYQSGDTPTTAELTTKATTYATNHDIEVPKVNINISFVPIWQSEEYKGISSIEQVSLGDTVYVDFSKMGLTATARVTKTVWDLAKNRYQSIELGSAKSTLSDLIIGNEDSINEVGETTVSLQGQISSLYSDLSDLSDTVSGYQSQLVNHYRLSGNSSVYFNINNGQFMAVLFIQRYSASQTGAVCLLEQYTANYTTFGSLGAVTVTKGTGRQFTIANTSSANVELVGLCGYFTAV